MPFRKSAHVFLTVYFMLYLWGLSAYRICRRTWHNLAKDLVPLENSCNWCSLSILKSSHLKLLGLHDYMIFRHPLLASLVTWQAQYLMILKALLETSTRSFCETVVIFWSLMLTWFRVTGAGLRMPWGHFFVAAAVLLKKCKIANHIGTVTSGVSSASVFFCVAPVHGAYFDFALATLCVLCACWIAFVWRGACFQVSVGSPRDLKQRSLQGFDKEILST